MNKVIIKDILVSLKTGLNPRNNFKLNTPDAQNWYITVTELNGVGVDFLSNTDRVNDKGLELINNRSNLEKDDILFSGTGSIGKTAIIKEKPSNWNIKEGVYALKPNKSLVDPYYLLCLLQNLNNSRVFHNLSAGSTVFSVPMKVLGNIEVVLPNLAMQRSISDIIKHFDDKIELNKKLNAELESMAKLIYDYWFVQFDFPDEKGKPYKSSGGKMVYSEELNREIPEGWVCANLSSITNLNPSLSIPKGQVASHLDMRSIPEKGYMTELPLKKEFKGGVKFQNGDVVIARITPCLENGKTAFISLLDNDEIGFGSTEFIVLRGVDPDYYSFLAFLARSGSFRTFAISKMTGTSGRRRVSASDVGEYKLAIPTDLTLFSRFNKLVMPKLKLMTSNTKENDALSKSRDWLLPMLMNGQITIKD